MTEGSFEPSVKLQESLVLVQELIFKISLEDKIKLLSGEDFWSTYALPSIGLRKMVLSDGPSGVRGSIWDERLPSLSLPSATCISASWNLDLVKKGDNEYVGVLTTNEFRKKGSKYFSVRHETILLPSFMWNLE